MTAPGHLRRILLPHVVNRHLTEKVNFAVLPRRMRQTPDLATPRGEQASNRKWYFFCITAHAHLRRILLYPTWGSKLILLYYRACALTPDHAIPRGEQASHRKW